MCFESFVRSERPFCSARLELFELFAGFDWFGWSELIGWVGWIERAEWFELFEASEWFG